MVSWPRLLHRPSGGSSMPVCWAGRRASTLVGHRSHVRDTSGENMPNTYSGSTPRKNAGRVQ
eukprot:9800846-Alexandrium_andersonii.AAC.1